MQKNSKKGIVISAVLYLLMFILASTCGLIHPACYAYVGTFVPVAILGMKLAEKAMKKQVTSFDFSCSSALSNRR